MLENKIHQTYTESQGRVHGGKQARKQLKPLGAQLARNFEERYSTLPFAERWAYPMLEKPFPKPMKKVAKVNECTSEEIN